MPSTNTLIEHNAHPGSLQHARRRKRRTARQRARPGAGVADLEAAHLDEQQQAGDDMHDTEQQPSRAPADQLAEHAARRLTEHDAQDLARDVAGEHRLAPLVGDDVPDPGDRQRE